MKRNQQTIRQAHQKRLGNEQPATSRYALKVASGKQMYGPHCCAHKVVCDPVKMAAARAANGVVKAYTFWIG